MKSPNCQLDSLPRDAEQRENRPSDQAGERRDGEGECDPEAVAFPAHFALVRV